MKHRLLSLTAVLIIGALSAGCVSGGSHLAFDREQPGGEETGEETGEATPAPTPSPEHASPVYEFITPVNESSLTAGSGSTLSQSPRFRNFGGTTFVSGNRSEGEKFRIVSSEIGFAGRKVFTK